MSEQKWWLFYSKRCQYSKKFIEMASKVPEIANKIAQVEVEANGDRLPAWLKSVPTLQMNEEILSGPQLLEWIQTKQKKELEPSPMTEGSGGFDINPYSSLSGSDDAFKSFSLIGQKNGSEGMEEGKQTNSDEKTMDQMTQERAADIRSLMA